MKLVVLVGPPGSGKSTLALSEQYNKYVYINQDIQGKGHLGLFETEVGLRRDIIVDRMGFNKQQRERYLAPAKAAGYETQIIVLHENRETCFKRCVERIGFHQTIHTPQNANDALDTFFTKYERPTLDEADAVEFRYPTPSMKLHAVICDIDGTMANIDHRLHFVRTEGKKDWKNFLLDRNVEQDGINEWCRTITNTLRPNHIIVMCSGRTDNLRKTTKAWLEKNKVQHDELFMRHRSDHRTDHIIKEILLDFEILTRYNVKFAIDDRQQVVDMWRRRDIVCLQCHEGNF